MATEIWVNIGSDNGLVITVSADVLLVPDGTRSSAAITWTDVDSSSEEFNGIDLRGMLDCDMYPQFTFLKLLPTV